MPSSKFQRTLSVLGGCSPCSPPPMSDSYHSSMPRPTGRSSNKLKYLTAVLRDANERRTVQSILSFQREFPDQYPWQVYFLYC